MPIPTPHRTAWHGSALGAVVLTATPLEGVAFSEYDSELVLYATHLSATQVGHIYRNFPIALFQFILGGGGCERWLGRNGPFVSHVGQSAGLGDFCQWRAGGHV